MEETEQSQLDIFTRMSGLYYQDLRLGAERFDVKGRIVWYASKEMLLRLKEMSPREKDRLDVIALRRLGTEPK